MSDLIKKYEAVAFVDTLGASFSISFESGETLDFSTKGLPSNIINELLAYGLKQKLVDSLAPRKASNWSEQDCIDRLSNVYEAMANGSFTVRAPGSSLQNKVEKAKEQLDKFLAMTPEQQALISAFTCEADLRKALNKATTALAKSLKEKN